MKMQLGLIVALTTAAPLCAQMKAPDWAYPDSPTHKQGPPPADFHRPPTTQIKTIGIFDGQTDVGSAVVRSLEGSLARLGRERVDILYFHNPVTMDGSAYVLEGTTVYVSEDAAKLLNDTFGTDAVTGDLKVGIAKLTVTGK